MGENQKSYTGGFKGNAWLYKKDNMSRMAYCRDHQPGRRRKLKSK